MGNKSKVTAKAVTASKPKVKAAPIKTKGVKSVAVKAAAKPTAKPAPKGQPPVGESLPAKAKATKVQPAITMAKEALKATNVKAEKAEKGEKPARSRKISVSASATEAASALAQKWISLFKKAEQIEAKPYNMKAVFEEKTAIMHKVLGWGYILANRNDRLEVLFKDGIKYLISNYKP